MSVRSLLELLKVRLKEKTAVQSEVVVTNAFRKKSFLQQPVNPTFIEEESTIVDSRIQIIDLFIKKKDFINVNPYLSKMGNLTILVESKKASIVELEKLTKARFEGRRSVNYGQQPFMSNIK